VTLTFSGSTMRTTLLCAWRFCSDKAWV